MLPTTNLLICTILLEIAAAWSPGLHITSSQNLSSSTTRLLMADDDEDIKSNAKHSGYMYWVLNYPAVVQTSEGRVLVLDFTGMDIAVGICCSSLYNIMQ